MIGILFSKLDQEWLEEDGYTGFHYLKQTRNRTINYQSLGKS